MQIREEVDKDDLIKGLFLFLLQGYLQSLRLILEGFNLLIFVLFLGLVVFFILLNCNFVIIHELIMDIF